MSESNPNPNQKRRDFLICCGAAIAGSVCASAAGADRSHPGMRSGEQSRVELASGQEVSGLPLFWLDDLALYLQRDGALVSFDPREASPPEPQGSFVVATQAELRSQLMAEYGSAYQVTTTKSFVIVQPRSAGSAWPDAMEGLQRAFQREFVVRNIPLRQGRFPLIAVITNSREAFYQQLIQSGQTPAPEILGIYSSRTNRVVLLDHGSSGGGVASTIRHEAAHQSAFNAGLHTRMADNPQWFVEGLGAFFESSGLAPQSGGDRKDTVWREAYHQFFPSSQALAGELPGLIGRDQTFSTNTQQGYAASWALTSYLLDRMPRAYLQLAANCGRLLPYQKYQDANRFNDFQEATETDLALLARNVHSHATT